VKHLYKKNFYGDVTVQGFKVLASGENVIEPGATGNALFFTVSDCIWLKKFLNFAL